MDERERARGLRQERVRASTQFRDGRVPQHARGRARAQAGDALRRMGEFFFGGQQRRPPRRCRRATRARRWARPRRDRPARDLARPLDGAGRDRRRARAHRSGVGRARLAVRVRRAASASSRCRSPIAALPAARRGRHLARSLRPPRPPDDPRARARATCRSSPRSASARTSRRWGVAARAHHRARLVGDARRCRRRLAHHRGAVAALLGARRSAIATARCGRRSWCADREHAVLLQRRHRPHPRVRRDPRARSARSIW